jgi:hypothetical protein
MDTITKNMEDDMDDSITPWINDTMNDRANTNANYEDDNKNNAMDEDDEESKEKNNERSKQQMIELKSGKSLGNCLDLSEILDDKLHVKPEIQAANIVTMEDEKRRKKERKNAILNGTYFRLNNQIYAGCTYYSSYTLRLYDYHQALDENGIFNRSDTKAQIIYMIDFCNEKIDINEDNLVFDDVLANIKVIPSKEEADKEYIDCLKALYQKYFIVNTISIDDIISREQMHLTKLINTIKGCIKNIGIRIYKAAKKGKLDLRIYLCVDEHTLTEYNRFPIYYNIPNSANKIITTFDDYITFLLLKKYPMPDDCINSITEKDWICHIITSQCRAKYPHISIHGYTNTESVIPEIGILLQFNDVLN